jgi:hypothetical protein
MRGKRQPNVFYGNQGFANQSHGFDVILHNINGGTILRKRKHPAPPLDEIDPLFHVPCVEVIHGPKLQKVLNLSRLDVSTRKQVYRLLQKKWSIFDKRRPVYSTQGLFVCH